MLSLGNPKFLRWQIQRNPFRAHFADNAATKCDQTAAIANVNLYIRCSLPFLNDRSIANDQLASSAYLLKMPNGGLTGDATAGFTLHGLAKEIPHCSLGTGKRKVLGSCGHA